MKAGGHGVLIVEDEEAIRDSLCELLTEEGYEATGAANGAEALRLLRDGLRPCLILLDLMMPVMDGWELHRQLKADPRLAAVPVVVITAADPSPADAIAAEEVLPKPLPIDRVLDVVDRYC